MSRKSAYALQARDPAFAAAWAAAVKAGARISRQDDEVEEVHGPRVSPSHGDTPPSRSDRERAFARMIAEIRESATLAP
jgi:hypothetical protein